MNCNNYFDKKIEIKEAICLMETKINELVEMYNRIDADHAIIAEKVKELEKLIDYLLGAGLEAEVKKKLEEWLADGTLADIIGDTLDKWTARIDDIANNKIPQLQERLESIMNKPQFEGAKCDGFSDDLPFLNKAIAKKGVLYLEGTFTIYDTLIIPNGTTIISKNARINFMKDTPINDSPAIDVKSNVTILGNINVYVKDNGQTYDGGVRCCLSIGNGDTGLGEKNIHIESVTCLGGYNGMAGVVILGDSSQITIGNIIVPDNNRLNKPFCTHWGNFNDHYLSNGVYVHKPNYQPTTHPHNIHVGNIIGGELTSTEETGCGAWISGTYNLTIDNIDIKKSRKALFLFCGDIGFKYANQTERNNGMCGIKIGNVKIDNYTYKGVDIYAKSYYEEYLSKSNILIDNIIANGENKNVYGGLALSFCNDIKVNSILTTNSGKGVEIGSYCSNIMIDKITLENCTDGLSCLGLSTTPLKNISVGNLYANGVNCNRGIVISHINHFKISMCEIKGYSTGILNAINSKNASYNSVKIDGATDGFTTDVNSSVLNNITINNWEINATNQFVGSPLLTTNGKEVSWSGNTTPSTITGFKIGTKVYNTDFSHNKCIGWVCTSDGWKEFGRLVI